MRPLFFRVNIIILKLYGNMKVFSAKKSMFHMVVVKLRLAPGLLATLSGDPDPNRITLLVCSVIPDFSLGTLVGTPHSDLKILLRWTLSTKPPTCTLTPYSS